MSRAMSNSWSIPHFTQMINVNAKNLMKVKTELGVSYTHIFIKLVSKVVAEVPGINISLIDDEIHEYDDINIAVAIGSDAGLVVPAIRNADKLSVTEISGKVKELAKKASEGTLTPEDVYSGTITVSSLGFSEVETGTPVLNSPQSTLVFFGKIRKEPVVDDHDQIVVGHVIGVSIVYDHRIIDGMTAQKFTSAIKREVENISIDSLL